MTLTAIDESAALIVIDLQRGIASMPTTQSAQRIARRVGRLAAKFRTNGSPVILVNVAGRPPGRTDVESVFKLPPDWKDLLPELGQAESDYMVTKQQISAFPGTKLEEILLQHGVTQVFLTGISTSSGVEATARSAYDAGFHVVVVRDATTDFSEVLHRHSLSRVLPKIAEVTTSKEVLQMMAWRRLA